MSSMHRLLRRHREFPRSNSPDMLKLKHLKQEMIDLMDKEIRAGELFRHSVYLQRLVELAIQVEVVLQWQQKVGILANNISTAGLTVHTQYTEVSFSDEDTQGELSASEKGKELHQRSNSISSGINLPSQTPPASITITSPNKDKRFNKERRGSSISSLTSSPREERRERRPSNSGTPMSTSPNIKDLPFDRRLHSVAVGLISYLCKSQRSNSRDDKKEKKEESREDRRLKEEKRDKTKFKKYPNKQVAFSCAKLLTLSRKQTTAAGLIWPLSLQKL